MDIIEYYNAVISHLPAIEWNLNTYYLGRYYIINLVEIKPKTP